LVERLAALGRVNAYVSEPAPVGQFYGITVYHVGDPDLLAVVWCARHRATAAAKAQKDDYA
jgi:hypothetical protein